MRSTSPKSLQLSGRRGCGTPVTTPRGKKKGDVGSVWEVVSTLASALTEARDQLVTLINNSNVTATRMSGGGAVSCSRHARSCNSPGSGGAWVPNVHRGHAHGHFAFGCSSEYRMHPSPVRVVRAPQPILHVDVSPPPEPKRPPRRCTHPLHRMHVLPPRGGSPYPLRPSRPQSTVPRRNVSPDPRGHCIGTQYAALLREQSHPLRERHKAGRSYP